MRTARICVDQCLLVLAAQEPSSQPDRTDDNVLSTVKLDVARIKGYDNWDGTAACRTHSYQKFITFILLLWMSVFPRLYELISTLSEFCKYRYLLILTRLIVGWRHSFWHWIKHILLKMFMSEIIQK